MEAKDKDEEEKEGLSKYSVADAKVVASNTNRAVKMSFFGGGIDHVYYS